MKGNKQFRQTPLQIAIDEILDRRGWQETDPERSPEQLADFIDEVRTMRKRRNL